MNVLVVGSGGREHALVRALRGSEIITRVFCSPGSDGIALDAECTPAASSSFQGLSEFVKSHNIKLVVIGPEQPLVEGLADYLRAEGILVVGPSKSAAQLEGSKIFSKEFMVSAGIPTAKSWIVSTGEEAHARCRELVGNCVLKVDGLAAGKGVYVCKEMLAAEHAIEEIFWEKKFGDASSRVLIEERLEGWELSYLVLTNGTNYEPLCLAQDHKRLKENDFGPNTGGMGAVAPIAIDSMLDHQIRGRVLFPVMRELQARNMDYRGILYVGLMITKAGPYVLEFNVRFGDPEAQVILPLLQGDWGDVFLKVAQGEVPKLVWRDLHAATVVVAAEGYPDHPIKGTPVAGLDPKPSFDNTSSISFGTLSGLAEYQNNAGYFLHAGTKKENGVWLTNGGRVLNSTAVGNSRLQALESAYDLIKTIRFKGMQIRTDIGVAKKSE